MGKIIEFQRKKKRAFNEELSKEAQKGTPNVKVFLDTSEKVHALLDGAVSENTTELDPDSVETYAAQTAIITGTLIATMIQSIKMCGDPDTSEMVAQSLASARIACKEG